MRVAVRNGMSLRLAVAGLIMFAGGCAMDAGGDTRGREYQPVAGVTRLESVALDGDDIGLVRDFDMIGDSIYLLDAMGRIVVIERRGDRLAVAGHIGRRGRGPGELSQPASMAAAGGNLVVIDGTRIQVFSRSGEALASKTLALPCLMVLPSVAPSRTGLFVHGTCRRTGVATDTMKAVLAWSADTSQWDIIVETPQFTTDGTMGSVFGAASLLTTGPDGRHVFGGGITNCIWHVDDTGSRPSAEEACPAARQLYSADPPPELERQMRSARRAGMNIDWPETLPVFGDRFVAHTDVVLLRPFSADSVVLQTLAPSSVDIAVAPFHRLLGCRLAGCLWLLEDDDAPRLIVLDRERMEMLLRSAVQ